MIAKNLRDHRGFSLPEVLIAATIMLVIMGAVMSLFLGSQRTARVETDFGDVQDNLRLAMDQLSKDVRMAGFLTVEPPLEEVSATEFVINTTTPARRYARITVAPSGISTSKTFTIYSESMVERFRPGDTVRIIRPPNQEQPGQDDVASPDFLVFTVASTDPDTNQMTLNGFSSTVDYAYSAGDMIVRTQIGAPLVSEVRYRFNPAPDNTLERIVNGGTPQILARNLTDVVFEYVLNDVGNVQAVNINLTGATSPEPDPNNKIARREQVFRTSVSIRNI